MNILLFIKKYKNHSRILKRKTVTTARIQNVVDYSMCTWCTYIQYNVLLFNFVFLERKKTFHFVQYKQ